MPTARHASSTSSSVASGRAKATLSRSDPANRNGSWGTVPSWRPDVGIEVDLVEEVARALGTPEIALKEGDRRRPNNLLVEPLRRLMRDEVTIDREIADRARLSVERMIAIGQDR
mgnify:CR=1 FL=1